MERGGVSEHELKTTPQPQGGLGALLSLIILDVLKPSRTIVYIGWWTMLGIYLISCIVALLTGG